MDRRAFVRLLAAAPLASAAGAETTPEYHVVTRHRPAAVPGMPGPHPGEVVSVRSERCVDSASSAANAEVVREMMARGMCALTGEKDALAAWRRFFVPEDVVGIKVNCGGHPWCVSAPEIVNEAVQKLMAVGLKPPQIFLYERFQNQLDAVNYAPHLPEGVGIVAAETANRRLENRGYDPETYVEADFFGEEDTRSNMMRLVSGRLTNGRPVDLGGLTSAATVGATVAEIETTICTPGAARRDLVHAKALAEALNDLGVGQ